MSFASAMLASSSAGPAARIDPRLKLIWLGWISVLGVILDGAPALGLLFASTLLVALGLRLPRQVLGFWAIILALIAWGTLASQALFYARMPRTVLVELVPELDLAGWTFPGLRIYREGMWYGLTQSLRMLSVTVAGLSVTFSTSPDRLLAALARLRVPGALGFLTMAALRFLPQLAHEAAAVRQAYWLRGGGRLSGPRRGLRLTARVRLALRLLLPVLALAVRRSYALSASLSARGFDPAVRRTHYPRLWLRPAERLALLLLITSGGSLVGAKLVYWLYLAELYYDPRLRPLYELVRRWM